MSARKFYIFLQILIRFSITTIPITILENYTNNFQLDIYSKLIYNQFRCWIATNRMQDERLTGRKTFDEVYEIGTNYSDKPLERFRT